MSQKTSFISEKEKVELDQKLYLASHPNFDKTITEPRFTIADLGINARDATYWDKQEILPKLKGKGIRKYDLAQGIWIRLIVQLRKLGVSTQIIKNFKEKLLQENSFADFLKSPYAIEEMQKAIDKSGQEFQLKSLLESGELTIEELSYNMFHLLITAVVIFKRNLTLLVFESGDYLPYSISHHDELIKADNNYLKALTNPHISVSINEAYVDLVEKWRTMPFFNDISILSNQELLVLESLKEKNIKSVTVNFTKEGKMDRLEIKRDKEVDLASRVGENFARNGFEDLTIKYGDGGVLHSEHIKKIKF